MDSDSGGSVSRFYVTSITSAAAAVRLSASQPWATESAYIDSLRVGSKLRCIRSTPTEMQWTSENDLECLANTGMYARVIATEESAPLEGGVKRLRKDDSYGRKSPARGY